MVALGVQQDQCDTKTRLFPLHPKASALLSLVVRPECSRRSASGSLQAKSRGRKCSIVWSKSNDPGRKGPLGAIKTDGNTDPFQLGGGGEVRSLDEVSRDPFATQDQTTWPYRVALVSSTCCGHSSLGPQDSRNFLSLTASHVHSLARALPLSLWARAPQSTGFVEVCFCLAGALSPCDSLTDLLLLRAAGSLVVQAIKSLLSA